MDIIQRKISSTICVAIVMISIISADQFIPTCGDGRKNKFLTSEDLEDQMPIDLDTKVIMQATNSRPDLIVASIDRSMLFTDNQALTISGTIFADIENQGDAATGSNFDIIFFEDSNNNGAFEATDNLLGSTTHLGSLGYGSSTTISASISGSVLFRDNLIYAFVDSGGVITEHNENNNLRETGQDCEYRPPIGEFNPVLEWAWTGSKAEPSWNQVMCAPAVADLNQDSIPDIVFNTFTGPGYYEFNGILRAISGDGSRELFSITSNDYRSAGGFNVAIADIDKDNLPEIINLRHRYRGDEFRLMAFENDGTFKWLGNAPIDVNYISGATVADIDEDGTPEIIIGRYAFNSDGALLWQGTGGTGLHISTVANLDMMDHPEIVAGNTAYYFDGTMYWQNINVPQGRPAVDNFDDDDYPEVVVVGNGYISMLEHDGTLKWGPYDVPPLGT
ncbi:MAG: hypothetical protein JSV09_01475, partial [Thermoplasmata archaeon]